MQNFKAQKNKNFSLTFPKYFVRQAGQTLIETVVAIFILVMGIVAAIGLAIYSLNASTNVAKQIVGIGLAREGIEAVRNMRDNNWLVTTISNSCYDFGSAQNNASCYDKWLAGDPGSPGSNKGFDFDPGNGNGAQKCFRIQVEQNANKDAWNIKNDNCSNNPKWGLDLDDSLSGSQFGGFFGVSNMNQGVTHGSSDFYRKIVITKSTDSPFDKSNMSKILVESQVWWVDKKCPRVSDFSSAKSTCKLSLQTYLTNWKNY